MRRWTALSLIAVVIALSGCTRASEPLRDSRESLGTFVSVTAYLPQDADEAAARDAVDAAYAEMAQVESVLDAHDADSAIARSRGPETSTLPAEATAVLTATDDLGVEEWFSPYLFEVVSLYDFEGGGNVPADAELDAALDKPRFDFGGAAKGLALDRAAGLMEGSSEIEAALITAGSTTVTFGSKPDDEPWRIAIEDPRDPDTTIGTIEASGGVTVSTSGDYQRYFERNGVRYHHILDPATGRPVRGMRSLTVIDAASGLDSDILSTALFVMGQDRAMSYARDNGLGLVIVDDKGRVHVVPGPDDVPWSISIEKR